MKARSNAVRSLLLGDVVKSIKERVPSHCSQPRWRHILPQEAESRKGKKLEAYQRSAAVKQPARLREGQIRLSLIHNAA